MQTSSSGSYESKLWKTPLEVVFQDDHLGIVVKPQGMTVMGGKPSLVRSDLLMPLSSHKGDALRKPIAAHRLDKPTGGLLVVAKTKSAETQLKNCFADRSCRKRYRALVCGRLPGNDGFVEGAQGTVDEPISGKSSQTKFRIVKYSRSPYCSDNWVTTVDLFPVTGRKHQLRRHMKFLGHPIFGDRRHGLHTKEELGSCTDEDAFITTSAQQPFARLCLWAMEIAFPHPVTGEEISATMANPEWLESLVEHLDEVWHKCDSDDKKE